MCRRPRNVMMWPFAPPAVQTDGVVVVNWTGRPLVAVAVTVSRDWARVLEWRVRWCPGSADVAGDVGDEVGSLLSEELDFAVGADGDDDEVGDGVAGLGEVEVGRKRSRRA